MVANDAQEGTAVAEGPVVETPIETTPKLVTMIQEFDAKRLEWESRQDDQPPGPWYMTSVGDIVLYAAATRQIKGFDFIYRIIAEMGRSLLVQYCRYGGETLPIGQLVSNCSTLGKQIVALDEPADRFRKFHILVATAEAIKAARDGNLSPGAMLLDDYRMRLDYQP